MSQRHEEWRCSCGTLLGIQTGESLHLKYKRAKYVSCGKVAATCPRCGRRNERSPADPGELASTSLARAGPDR